MGALLGDDVLEAGPGDLVHKPRGEWHTFWNAGDEPCRILEIIAPAGFERFFAELDGLGGALKADPADLARAERALRPGDAARDGACAARALRAGDRHAAQLNGASAARAAATALVMSARRATVAASAPSASSARR